MKKILLILTFGLLPFLMVYPSVSANQNNLNSQNFMVNVNAFDPLGGNHSWGVSASSGPQEIFLSFIRKVTNILLILIPILAGISFVIAGYFYIFSAGDSEKAGRAKTIIKWNIIAIFIGFLSFLIVSIVSSFFN